MSKTEEAVFALSREIQEFIFLDSRKRRKKSENINETYSLRVALEYVKLLTRGL